jgi:hypothetical protein
MRAQADIERLVRAELDLVSDPRVRDQISRLLVGPRRESRPWDYGPGDIAYPCWIILEHPQSNTGIAYCDEGFGPRCPWGLLWLQGDHLSMGMDCSWYANLEDAFRESIACDVPASET